MSIIKFTKAILALTDAVDAENRTSESREALMVSLLGHILIMANYIRFLLAALLGLGIIVFLNFSLKG